jgi:hypothetical protein
MICPIKSTIWWLILQLLDRPRKDYGTAAPAGDATGDSLWNMELPYNRLVDKKAMPHMTRDSAHPER